MSSWLSRACVVVVMISVWVVGTKSSAVTDDRHTSSLNRLVTRLCDAILAGADDVIDAQKRKWAENTMMAWGKRSDVDTLYALSVCESLQRSRRRRHENFMSAWENRNNYVDTEDPWWVKNDLELSHERSSNYAVDAGRKYEAKKRKWNDNSMAAWGKRGWAENSMEAWGKRNNLN